MKYMSVDCLQAIEEDKHLHFPKDKAGLPLTPVRAELGI